jgi:hypothetical protein
MVLVNLLKRKDLDVKLLVAFYLSEVPWDFGSRCTIQ